MKCPFCSHDDTDVVDSRVNESEVRRRRECAKCAKRFTTYEKPELELTILKKDGGREPFDIIKVKAGIEKACSKCPITPEHVAAMVSKVEQKVRTAGKEEIKSDFVGRLVMKELLKADKIAYLRFASVCKSFDDPKLFEKEIALLKD